MKTKSISLILVLAILITVGGVYAAWIYAETPAAAAEANVGFGLASSSTENSKGTITVDASAASIAIDQTATDNYKANLVADGSITITFTPSSVFTYTNTATALTMQWQLICGNDAPTTYECNDGSGAKVLFTKFDTTTAKSITLTKQDNGTYTATLAASSLLDLLTINDFTLDTLEKYNTFSGTLNGFGTIGIQVSEPQA